MPAGLVAALRCVSVCERGRGRERERERERERVRVREREGVRK